MTLMFHNSRKNNLIYEILYNTYEINDIDFKIFLFKISRTLQPEAKSHISFRESLNCSKTTKKRFFN